MLEAIPRVWISTRCEDTSSGVPVLSAHVIVDQAHLAQGHSGEVQDKRGECLGAHFDVEPLHLPARTGTPQETRGRGRTTEAPGYSR